MKRILAFFRRENVILATYMLLSLIIAVQHYVGGPYRFNNFVIFRQSFFHLTQHLNLHLEYPAEYFDIFLYHPAFAVMFSPFSLMPVLPAIVLWLTGCSLLLFYAIKKLPITESQKIFFWWFVLVELNTSLHGQQTNPIIAALGLLTFSAFEKGKLKWAALFPVLAFCIKGYGAIFAGLFLFYPGKGRFVLYSIGWLIVTTLLPLPITGFDHFAQVYSDWFTCLVDDHKVNYGFSVMGLIKVWWPAFTESGVSRVQMIGVGLFAATWLLNLKQAAQSDKLRMLLLAYAFLWVILFNHASESPTFIIAVMGPALFHVVNKDRMKPWSLVLVWLVLMFTMFAPTDIYPRALRSQVFVPYLVKVIPCLLVWCVLQYQLFRRGNELA